MASGVKTISNPATLNAEKKDELVAHETVPLKPEVAGSKPHLAGVDRAVPKPLPEPKVQLPENIDADSLDREMAANNMTDQQLADSDEPSFLETLAHKQQSQKELCQLPAKMRSQETTRIEAATKTAQGQSDKARSAMYTAREGALSDAVTGQNQLKTDDEILLEGYYADIESIFATTEKAVSVKLECLDCRVAEIFDAAVDDSFDIFKDNVSERLDDYYGADLWIVTVSNEDEEADNVTRFRNSIQDAMISKLTEQLNTLQPDDPQRAKIQQQIDQRAAQKAKLIIDQIFEEEKARFMNGLDNAIDSIATLVETELNAAKRIVKEGKASVKSKSKTLPEHLQETATEKTNEFIARFDDLEQTVDDKEADLVDSLAKQYAENVNKLAEEFEKIRASEAMSIWEKALQKIKEIALIIYNLGKTLAKVAVKAAGVIGDILAHPIRFIGNLIDAIGAGFRNFKDNIVKHLQDIVFKLLLRVVPPGVELPQEWNGKGVLTFILSLVGLSKANIRKQAVDKLGEPMVQKLEQSFEWFIILKNEGFGGLWEHVKERIGNIKDEIFKAAITFFKEQIIWKAIEFLLSVLTPVSGFIKACKTIINVVGFFLKNLGNLIKLFDSIVESFADMVAGRISNAALRIETTLADLLLVGIKFLAALVGISIDRIQDKVGRIVRAVQGRINRAIGWVIDKGRAFAQRTGVTKAFARGKAAVDRGKAWAREKGRATVGILTSWWKQKETFETIDGREHSVFTKEVNGKLAVMVASDEDFLERLISTKRQSKPDLVKELDNLYTAYQTLKADVGKADSLKVQSVKDNKQIKANANAIARGLKQVKRYLKKVGIDDFTPQVAELNYLTDSQNRPVKVTGRLGNVPGGRNLSAQTAVSRQLNTNLKKAGINLQFDAGHLVADTLGGAGHLGNLVPMESRVNKSYISTLEGILRKRLNNGETLYVSVEADYQTDLKYDLQFLDADFRAFLSKNNHKIPNHVTVIVRKGSPTGEVVYGAGFDPRGGFDLTLREFTEMLRKQEGITEKNYFDRTLEERAKG
ncbi:MAG: DNA/RNA non-specific endonuclease [Lewinellaceae bacterium]|nr:DNA/RNA non-specific endonuclease [Lewinellaceae bacterium]